MSGPFVINGDVERRATSFEDGWRLADETIRRLADTEAGNEVPPSDTRTFRPMHARQARRVSPWGFILAVILSTAACAGLIGWFVSAALRAHI